MFGPELYVAHELASALQQAIWIGDLGATEEPDVDVSFEGVDIGECPILYTSGRMAIMQQFAYIISTIADNVEPMPRDSA